MADDGKRVLARLHAMPRLLLVAILFPCRVRVYRGNFLSVPTSRFTAWSPVIVGPGRACPAHAPGSTGRGMGGVEVRDGWRDVSSRSSGLQFMTLPASILRTTGDKIPGLFLAGFHSTVAWRGQGNRLGDTEQDQQPAGGGAEHAASFSSQGFP